MSRRKIEIRDDEIYELREQGMSYERIAEYYSIKGIKITYSTIGYRCKKIYKEKGQEEPKIKNRINEATDEEIYKLREQKMTYKEIMEYFEKKGVKISIDTLSVRCKKIYKEKGQEEPKIKNRINEATDEEIYELREQGMTHKEIAKYFNDKGIPITRDTIAKRCKTIYIEKGKEEPKAKKGKKERDDVTNEEIYELREQGMTYERIAEYYSIKGIKITYSTIGYRCKKIYKEKGQEEPKIKNRINEATDEEIYKLREQKMTYKEIMEYFEKKGVKISIDTLSVRCKKIYKEKGQEEPKIKNRINEATDEEIYELREQGMTYERIAEYYSIKGIKITYSTIGYRCKKIYKEKGQEEPKIKNRINEATNEEIYKLREQKMTYKEIMEYFEKKGVKISIDTLSVRCKKIYKEKGKDEPKIKRKNMIKEATDEEIYELREQGMTHKEIAKYFNDKGIPITRVTIAKRCKTIYIEKGKEEPKAKKGKKERDDVTNEKLYELREKGMKYEEIVKYFEEKGIKISQSQVCKRCKKIYEEKGKEEPKAKRGRKKNNNTKLLGNLNNTLNKRIKEKIGTEKELAELKYKEKNTEGAEK